MIRHALPAGVLLLVTTAAPAADPEPVWKVRFADPGAKFTSVRWVGITPDGQRISVRTESPKEGSGGQWVSHLRTLDIATKTELPKPDLGTKRPFLSGLGPPCAFRSTDVVLTADGSGAGLYHFGNPSLTRRWVHFVGETSGVWAVGGKGLFTAHWESTHWLVYQPTPDKPGGDPKPLKYELKQQAGGLDLAALAVSPDGTRLASAYYGGSSKPSKLRLHQISVDRTLQLTPLAVAESPHQGRITSMQFSPDGRKLATGSDDTNIRLWDTTNPPAAGWAALATPKPPGLGFGIRSLAFRPDGKLLAYDTSRSAARGVGLVDVRRGKIVHTFPTEAEVNSVAFSRNGRTLATGCHDGMVQLWDVSRILPNAGQ